MLPRNMVRSSLARWSSSGLFFNGMLGTFVGSSLVFSAFFSALLAANA